MKTLFKLALLSVVCLFASAAQAQTVTIKLATIAPDGSSWHNLLKEMGEKWAAASGGKVKLKIYPGGVAGNEGDIVKKLRVGQLQAAAISSVGVHEIEAAPQLLGAPGLMTTDEEFEYVFDKLKGKWEKRLEDKGFVVLTWGDTGWARLFFKKAISKPEECKGLKIFAWAGDPASVEAWRLAGFQPVVISSTDMLPSLSTGMIEGFATTPIMAATARWYEQAPNMPDVQWGRLVGATIVTKEAWNKVPADLQPKLLEVARDIGKRIDVEVAKMINDSMESMKKNGLKVLPVTAADQAKWMQLAEKSFPAMRGGVGPAEDFDEIKKLRDEFRASKGKK